MRRFLGSNLSQTCCEAPGPAAHAKYTPWAPLGCVGTIGRASEGPETFTCHQNQAIIPDVNVHLVNLEKSNYSTESLCSSVEFSGGRGLAQNFGSTFATYRRLTIATRGQDHRLGICPPPPAPPAATWRVQNHPKVNQHSRDACEYSRIY